MNWKKTGTPAHNNAIERSPEDLDEYEANPTCSECGGSGEIIIEQPVRNYEGECVDVEFINHPCDCIFVKWQVLPEKNCKQCKGTGQVQERLLHPDTKEEFVRFHDCVCLRYVREVKMNE